MRTMTMASLLLLSTVCAIPASASYFFNSYWGTMLNVGSAPNPTPEQLRAIGDSRWARAPQGNQGRSSASVVPATTPAPPMESVAPIPVSVATTSPTVIIVPRFSPKEEKRITAELNKASLMRATTIASKVPAAANKKTASKSATPVKTATAKGKPPVRAAATTNGEKKPRV